MRDIVRHSSLLFIILLFSNTLLSQKKDSLRMALQNATHDTVRCEILNVMIESEDNDEIWPKYNEELLKIAGRNDNIHGPLANQFKKYYAMAINNSGLNFQNLGEMDKALSNFEKSLELQLEIEDKLGAANSLTNIGVLYKELGDIFSSEKFQLRALKLYEEVHDNYGIESAYNNLGMLFKLQGNIPKALEYYHKALKIQEQISDKKGIALSLNNLAVIYGANKDSKMALDYNFRSLKIRKEIGDRRGEAMALNNIGTIYLHIKDLDKALDYQLESMKIREEAKDKQGMAFGNNNIGIIYYHKGEYDKAKSYYERALVLFEDMGDRQGVGNSYDHIALTLLKMKRPKEALDYANKSLTIAKQLGIPDDIRIAAQTLRQIYQDSKNFKSAFEMFDLEIKMRDSVNSQESKKAAVKKQMQYEYEKKELVLRADQDKKDLIAREALLQKESERNYFIGGFGLVLLLAIFIFRSYRQKQKDNMIILQQKHIVEEKQKEILDSIHYAKRIQTALMSNEKSIAKMMGRLNK